LSVTTTEKAGGWLNGDAPSSTILNWKALALRWSSSWSMATLPQSKTGSWRFSRVLTLPQYPP